MSYAQFQQRIAADAGLDERVDFIRKTYLHLGGSVLACAFIVAGLVNSAVGLQLAQAMVGSWLLVLGLFMVVSTVASRWASPMGAPSKQYLGLGLFIVAQAVILTPLLFAAQAVSASTGSNVIGTAGVLTVAVFGGLTATVFTTKKDFSFMGQALSLLTFGAMGMFVVAYLFGFTLGNLFAGAMVVLMAGWILYSTSNVLHTYPIGSHVAASLFLFSSVALLFFYILQLVMSFAGDD